MNEHAKETSFVKNESKKEIQFGDIVTLKSHPYLLHENKLTSDERRRKDQKLTVKITAYNRTTPPLMVVVEIRKGNKFDKTTRKKSTSVKCIHYSTVLGRFEEHWFKENELKLIETYLGSLYDAHKDFDLTKLRNELIGQQAILTTVDIELGKVKLYKDSDPDKIKFRESSLLDFLPPLGTITNISTIDSHVQYDEHTGNKEFEKCRIKAKIKWYNNESHRFSEEEVPLVAMKKVDIEPDISTYNLDSVYYIEKEILLEENEDISVTKIPIKIHDLVFKHYYYLYRVKSLFTNNFIVLEKNENPILLKISDPIDFEGNVKFENTEPEKKRGDFKNNLFSWFRILYRDVSDNYTTRIIRTIGVYDLEIGNENGLLKANCLLRDGKIRHFRMDRILGYEKMDWFEEEFVQKSTE